MEFSGVRLFRDLHLYFRDVIMQAVQMYRSQYTRAWEPVVEHEKIIEAPKRRDPDVALYYLRSISFEAPTASELLMPGRSFSVD